jgi:hypothetical protein
MVAIAAVAERQFCATLVTCKAMMAPNCRKCKSREKLRMLKMLQLQLRDSDATAAQFSLKL